FLTTDGPGTTAIASPSVTTFDVQKYLDPVRLTSDATLTAQASQFGTTIQFGGSVDGAHGLTLNSSGGGGIIFLAPVGATTPLARLNITKGLTTIGGGSVTTAGVQNYLAATL